MFTPEFLARQQIDQLLTASGWSVQNRGGMNLYARRGMAIREFLVEAGLKRAGRLRQEVLKTAFVGKLS
jgi:hypothetical protein